MALAAASFTAHLPGNYLTVILDHEAYGIRFLNIREIVRMQQIAPVGQAPGFVKGVIQLPGGGILVVDLREKFGLNAAVTGRTGIVVVRSWRPDEPPVQLGLIVDSVADVVKVTAEEIEPAARFGLRIDPAYVLGRANVNGLAKALLDLDRIVASESARAAAAVA